MIIQLPEFHEKQKQFLLARAKHIGFGGARGGGKSFVVRWKAKLFSFNYPGIRCLIVRRTYPELINNHINILRKELIGVAKYNDKDKVLKFNNGSTIPTITINGEGTKGEQVLSGEGTIVGNYVTAYIPEPTTTTLSLLALAGLAVRRRRASR